MYKTVRVYSLVPRCVHRLQYKIRAEGLGSFITPSAQISYCKRRMRKTWERGYVRNYRRKSTSILYLDTWDQMSEMFG